MHETTSIDLVPKMSSKHPYLLHVHFPHEGLLLSCSTAKDARKWYEAFGASLAIAAKELVGNRVDVLPSKEHVILPTTNLRSLSPPMTGPSRVANLERTKTKSIKKRAAKAGDPPPPPPPPVPPKVTASSFSPPPMDVTDEVKSIGEPSLGERDAPKPARSIQKTSTPMSVSPVVTPRQTQSSIVDTKHEEKLNDSLLKNTETRASMKPEPIIPDLVSSIAPVDSPEKEAKHHDLAPTTLISSDQSITLSPNNIDEEDELDLGTDVLSTIRPKGDDWEYTIVMQLDGHIEYCETQDLLVDTETTNEEIAVMEAGENGCDDEKDLSAQEEAELCREARTKAMAFFQH